MIVLTKKTFEISHIQSVEELNHLSLKLNEKEQVSHIKVNKDSIVFHCLDIDALLSLIQSINKDLVVKEVIDGKKREYDFAKKKDRQYYFMFKNMITEDDIYVLVERIEKDHRYQNVRYDAQNKLLLLTSNQRDVLSLLRKELFKINPSVEIIEHHRPIRSQDVFNEKYLHTYIRVGILLVVIALALVTSKDHTWMTPVLWLVTVILLGTPLLKKAWGDIFGMSLFAVLLALTRTVYAKFGRNIFKALLCGMSGSVVCYIVVAISPFPVISLISCVALGICTAMLWPGTLILMDEKIPAAGVAAYALMAAGGDFGASIAPQTLGILVDNIALTEWAKVFGSTVSLTPEQVGFKIGMLMISIFPILGVILLLYMKKFFQKQNER